MVAPAAELLTQLRDLHVYSAFVGGTLEHAPPVRDEAHEQVELPGRKVERLFAKRRGSRRLVDPEAVEIHSLRDWKPPSQDRVHARKEDLPVERLRHIVVSSGIEAAHYVLARGPRGEHYDARRRKCGRGAYPLRYRETVETGEHHVEKQQVGLLPLHHLEPVVASRRGGDVGVSGAEKRHLEERAYRRVVLYDADLCKFTHGLQGGENPAPPFARLVELRK